jgi:TRAP-type C4-dicarboxylate transport system permease large subunit
MHSCWRRPCRISGIPAGMLLTLPVFLPIIKSLGYDPVWFGILFNINMQIAYLSPPFGGAWFFLKSLHRLTSPWKRSSARDGRG